MAKSFDEVSDHIAKHFLYLKTRTMCNWLVYPAVPPPFNLLSAPYYLMRALLVVDWSRLSCWSNSIRLSVRRRPNIDMKTAPSDEETPRRGHSRMLQNAKAAVSSAFVLNTESRKVEAELPASWHDSLGEDPVEYLTRKIVEFKKEQADEGSQQADFQKDVFKRMDELQEAILELRAMHESSLQRAERSVPPLTNISSSFPETETTAAPSSSAEVIQQVAARRVPASAPTGSAPAANDPAASPPAASAPAVSTALPAAVVLPGPAVLGV
eukprot:6751354-Prymnesium_polylepis.1